MDFLSETVFISRCFCEGLVFISTRSRSSYKQELAGSKSSYKQELVTGILQFMSYVVTDYLLLVAPSVCNNSQTYMDFSYENAFCSIYFVAYRAQRT